MKKFIAYFDYLGFGNFIENNDFSTQREVMMHILRDIESALGKGMTIKTNKGFIADISNSKIHCINFSDTVIFWIKNNQIELLEELLEVSYHFNWMSNRYSFPVRGALVYDELEHIDFRNSSNFSSTYNVNSVFGKGIVKAHQKAESQNWAGFVIDQSVIEILQDEQINQDDLLNTYCIKYIVPYKEKIINKKQEYVYKLMGGRIDYQSFIMVKEGIERNFFMLKQDSHNPSVIVKLNNTIEFLKSHIDY